MGWHASGAAGRMAVPGGTQPQDEDEALLKRSVQMYCSLMCVDDPLDELVSYFPYEKPSFPCYR